MRYLIFIFCFFLVSCGDPIDPRIGMDIGNIILKNENLIDIKLLEFKGKPSIINLWASWCAPCIKEMPSLMALQKQGNYNIILINMDPKLGQGSAMLEKHGLKPIISLWDKQGKIMREKLSAMHLPQTFITDKNMIIKGVEVGDKDWVSSKILQRIQNCLD